jgi:Septum formation
MSTEFPNQPDELDDRPPATEFPPPPLTQQAEAVDWAPPPWANRPAAGPPSDPGSIAGWTPPPWSPDAADTRPFWRRIPAIWLEIAAALVLVGGVVGWYFIGVATGEPEVAPAQPTQVRTGVATSDETEESEDLNSDINIDDSVDLHVGDCFDIKDPYAEIELVKEVPCSKEHEFELFHVGAMGKRSSPTLDAFADYVVEYCDPAFGDYIGKAPEDSDLDYDWLVPTEDAWRSGDRTVQCAAYDPNISRLTRSLRGIRQ